MKYKLEDKLKITPLLMYGLQWWVVAAPSIIVMGLVVAKLHFGTDITSQILYMQKLFCIVGATLLAQILFGHKLPVVTGPASVLLIGVLASISSGISAIYTAIFVGGIIITLVALSGLLKHLHAIFTSRIIIVIMLLIPFTLTPTILKLIFQDTTRPLFNLLFALLFVITLIITNRLLKGVWKSTTLIWGILMGTAFIFLVNGFPVTENAKPITHDTGMSFFINFDFDAGVILSFLFCAMVLIINEVGSIQAVGHMLNADKMPERNKRGVMLTGISNMLSGLTGVMGSVDYTTSPGIIAASHCASRYPFIPAAILLIACSFSPSLIATLLTIPGIIMGAVLLYIMCSQLAAGLHMLIREKAVQEFNDGLILGLPLMVAITISFVNVDVITHIPGIIRPVLGNGFVMGVITALLMEHVIFRKKS